jgi:hypothetical protein
MAKALFRYGKFVVGIAVVIGLGWWILRPPGRPILEQTTVAAEYSAPVSAIVPKDTEKNSGSKSGSWTSFRGSRGDGVSESTNTPTKWSATENLLWSAKLPGPGASSPIVFEDKVFVTCYSGYGDGSEGNLNDLKRHLFCLSRDAGKILWETTVSSSSPEDRYSGYITEHGYASSTPVTDGTAVYCFFGKSGVHTFDMAGKPLWNTSVGTSSGNRRWGSAASPIVFGDMVIVNASEESRAVIALDKKTGKQVWKAEGRNLELCYGTPVVHEVPGKKPEVVLALPGEIWGLNPLTGGLKWFASTRLTGNVSPSVCIADDLAIAFGGYPNTASVAVKTGGSGDVSSSGIVWTGNKSSYVPSGVVKGKHIYWVNDRGLATCAETATGKILYQERIGLGGGESASRPVYGSTVLAGDNLYSVTRQGGVFVWKASETFTKIGLNKIEGDETDFNPSLAISDNKLFLRSNKAVYCVGSK